MPDIFKLSRFELGLALSTAFKFPAMRPIRLLLIYLLLVFAGGALLAPWLYALAHSAAAHSPALQHLASSPFHRYVHRSLLGLALIFLWPLFSQLGLRSWRDFGLATAFAFAPGIVSPTVTSFAAIFASGAGGSSISGDTGAALAVAHQCVQVVISPSMRL